MGKFRIVVMSLFLGGLSIGIANAASIMEKAEVQAVQQKMLCSGVVKDAMGETVIGASVVVKGTTNGSITDVNGKFTLSDVKVGDVLQVSFVGYSTQEIEWSGKPLEILMREDTQVLDVVLVTAYGGRQLRSKVTNSIAKVEEEVFSTGMHTNPVIQVMYLQWY